MRKLSTRAAISAIVLGCAATTATADENSGGFAPNFYVSAGAGVGIILDRDMVFTTVPGNNTFEFSFDPGVVLQGAVGTRLPYGFRFELEAGYSDNKLDSTAGFGAGNIDTAGDIRVMTFMANVLYEYDMTDKLSVFAGAGAGVALMETDFRRGPSNPAFILAQGNETRFAYQGLLGVNYDVANDIELFARYSFLGTLGDDFSVVNSSGAAPFPTSFDFSRHAVTVGVTFHFGL